MSYQNLVDFPYWTLIAQLCNLFIQIYLFKKFLFKPVKDIVAKRQKEVDAIYEDADEVMKKAQAAKDEYEAKLIQAHKDAEDITARAHASATQRSEALVSAARDEAARLREKASKEIEFERQQAMNEVKGEISDIAIDIASKIVEEEIDKSKHDKLIEKFIDELGD